MEPEFGVGIEGYLFENFSNTVYVDIESQIRKQTAIFLPVITIREVAFDRSNPDNLLWE